jgi:hypothetical protein
MSPSQTLPGREGFKNCLAKVSPTGGDLEGTQNTHPAFLLSLHI